MLCIKEFKDKIDASKLRNHRKTNPWNENIHKLKNIRSKLTPKPVPLEPLLEARMRTLTIIPKTVQLMRRQRYMGIMKLTHFQGLATQQSVLFLPGVVSERDHMIFYVHRNLEMPELATA